MSFTYNAWMPTQQKHDLTELAKAARAKASGKTYEPKPYVHVKGRIIATMDSADLAALKLEAGIVEAAIVQDTSTWSMAAGVWTRDAGPVTVPVTVEPEPLSGSHLWSVNYEPQPAPAPVPPPKSTRRSVAGTPRIDCVKCAHRHYANRSCRKPHGLTG